jgi:hypothetical protein
MAKSPERQRARFRGRKSDHTFLRLPHYVTQSPEWRSLSGNAVKFLVELASAYNGRNNGDLSLTRRQALKCGWKSGGTRDRAAEEAVEAGFAIVTRQGSAFGQCTLYAITWEPVDEVGKNTTVPSERVASRLWQKRERQAQNGAGGAP